MRQSRLRAMPRSRFAAIAVLLAWAMIGAGLRTGGPRRIVRATDPAGAFTLAFQGSRIVAASLDGTPVPADRIHQSAGRLVIRGGDGPRDFAIHLLPNGAIYWHSRAARGPDHP